MTDDLRAIAGRAWLIWGVQGEYSDRNEWPIAVAFDQAAAEAATERLGELWRELLSIYRRREDELFDAGDALGETLFENTDEGREYLALSGGIRGGYLGSCYAEDRTHTCCEVHVLRAILKERQS